ncbi:MAG: ABC transporter ATP-binding protein [Methanobacteriota archaeon]|nr:MAG: ABC transporter ATP-binding protein [Euryarchaeota archaeon]
MRILTVEDLVSGYRDVDILKGLSLHIEEGEIVAIIGPNGAGKSTLMKTVFGLIRPRSGRIVFRDRDIAGLKPDRIVRLGMGYVPQRDNVFPSLTVLENLEMGAFIIEDRRELERSLQRVYELLPVLERRSRERARNLSGGEQQMLAIGRAMMLEPALLLLDEPSAGLAPALVDSVFDRIREISSGGTAVAIVEQNARKALAMADRGYVLDMGRTRFEGRGEELLDNEEVKRLYLGG